MRQLPYPKSAQSHPYRLSSFCLQKSRIYLAAKNFEWIERETCCICRARHERSPNECFCYRSQICRCSRRTRGQFTSAPAVAIAKWSFIIACDYWPAAEWQRKSAPEIQTLKLGPIRVFSDIPGDRIRVCRVWLLPRYLHRFASTLGRICKALYRRSS